MAVKDKIIVINVPEELPALEVLRRKPCGSDSVCGALLRLRVAKTDRAGS